MQNEASQLIFLVVSGTLIFFLLIIFIVTSLLIYQKKQRLFLEEKATLKAQYDQEILKSQLEVQNATLQNVGRELHDNIGQLLSVAQINLNVLEESQTDEEGYIKQTNEVISQSIAELRALTKSLDGDFVQDFGLEQSLSHELQRIRKTRKFETEISIHGDKKLLGYEKEIVLFRVSQEILNNALKHSKAKNLTILIQYSPQSFQLIIADDGLGFDLQSINQQEMSLSGAGIRNIQRRIALIGGTIDIDSKLNTGTKISINLPFS
jgi:signal transduction histidine kinase